MPKLKIDYKAIVTRGYCLDEEYEALVDNGQGRLIKVLLTDKSGRTESIWGVEILKDDNHFILANDPLAFINGPRPAAALIGYKEGFKCDIDKTLDLFKRCAKESIEYYKASMDKLPKLVKN